MRGGRRRGRKQGEKRKRSKGGKKRKGEPRFLRDSSEQPVSVSIGRKRGRGEISSPASLVVKIKRGGLLSEKGGRGGPF